MNLKVYIIKQGSAESRLLLRAGFDRKSLPVAEWKGRRRSRGGFGKAPVAWRVEGEDNVRKLCGCIVSILDIKSVAQITPDEKSALDRARRTLAAMENRSERQERVESISMNRQSIIEHYFSQRFPSASSEDVSLVAGAISQGALDSIKEMEKKSDELLDGKISGWRSAVQMFIATGKI